MNRYLLGAIALALAMLPLIAFGEAPRQTSDINPADFQTRIDNPLLPLTLIQSTVFEGQEEDPDTGETIETRVEMTLLPDTDTVAGVEVVVINDKAFENGELVESTLDYYAQHRNGDVYYFGERVDNYENGEIINHNGSWLAGEGENEPGIAMPADPEVGDEFNTENAPGIAEDQLTILSIDEDVRVPAGSFHDCVKVDDFNPLDDVTEQKWFCPTVGFAREAFEEGELELVSVTRATQTTPTPIVPPPITPQPTPTPAPVGAPITGDGPSEGTSSWALMALAVLAVLVLGGAAIAGTRLIRRQR